MPPPRIATLAREPFLTFPQRTPVAKDASGYGTGTAGFGLGSWGLTPGSTGIAVTPLTALGIATAWICVKRLAEDNGKLPRRVMERLPSGGARPDYKHPLNMLLKEPNPWQSASQFWGYVTSWWALRGNAFIVVMRDRETGQPKMLLPLSPDRCSVRLSPTNGLVYYQITHPAFREGQSVMMHRDDVMHIRNVISFDGYTGISPIAAAPDVFGLGIAAQQNAAVLFRQGGQLSGVIKHPAKLNPEGRNYLRQEFDTVHSGVQNAFHTAVLDEGMSWEGTSMTAEDSQLLESRTFSVLEVARMFGVPPHKAGDWSRAHFANMEQGNLQYWSDTLQPLGKQQEEEADRTLFYSSEQSTRYLAIDYDELLRADRKTRYETDEIGIRSGRLTQNEARISDGRDPNVPNGDKYQIPMNVTTTDGKGAPNKPDPTIAADETGGSSDEGMEGGDK